MGIFPAEINQKVEVFKFPLTFEMNQIATLYQKAYCTQGFD